MLITTDAEEIRRNYRWVVDGILISRQNGRKVTKLEQRVLAVVRYHMQVVVGTTKPAYKGCKFQ